MAHILRGARDGHPVQRRVSYRKLRDGDSDSSGESHDENCRSGGGDGLVTRQVPLSASSAVTNAISDADDDHRAEHDDEVISLYASLVTPTSIGHEIWLAMRYGAIQSVEREREKWQVRVKGICLVQDGNTGILAT